MSREVLLNGGPLIFSDTLDFFGMGLGPDVIAQANEPGVSRCDGRRGCVVVRRG